MLLLLFLHASLLVAAAQDLYAFPKYSLTFLHAHPLDNITAQRWLRDGIHSEREFQHGAFDTIDPVDDMGIPPVLEHMRLGYRSYVCLIPPAPTLPSSSSPDDTPPVAPSHTWSLLQPLSDTCLYHRQAWFTYSYCHNLHVRQFRELPTTFPHPPGARVVEEDPEWESYTLGKAPTGDGELAVTDGNANLELARQGAGQRYLVQRWSDGTVCDKTGRPREIEIQFHCSMTMTDTILFVKETRTCEYVLVIHTPRLCGEPGFKSRFEQMPQASIRCREVVDALDTADPTTLPETPHPVHRRPRKPLPAPEQRTAPDDQDNKDSAAATKDTVDTAKLIRKAIESILGRGNIEDVALFQLQQGEDENEFYVSLDPEAQAQDHDSEPIARGRGETLEQALRAAGYEIKGQKPPPSDNDEKEESQHDEL